MFAIAPFSQLATVSDEDVKLKYFFPILDLIISNFAIWAELAIPDRNI